MKNVILEEILTLAIDELKRAKKADSDFESGRKMAFYEILSLAKEQADLLNIKFDDETLNRLEPEQLLKSNS